MKNNKSNQQTVDFPVISEKIVPHTADSLNNCALTYLDKGMSAEAEECWEEALKTDPDSAILRYNYDLHLWKTARIDDMEAVRRLTSVSTKDVNYYRCLAQLHIARRDAESAIERINEAIAIYGKTDALKQTLTKAKNMKKKGLDGRCVFTLEENIDLIDSIKSTFGALLDDEQLFSKMRDNKVYAVCFSPSGRMALSAGTGSKVMLWNTATGDCIQAFEYTEHSEEKGCLWDAKWSNVAVWSVCFSPGSGQWISGGENLLVKLWSNRDGQCVKTLKGHTGAVRSVCYSPDGRLCISGGEDHLIKLWQINSGKCIKTLKGHTGMISSVCFSPDGNHCISGSEDHLIKLWHIESGKCTETLKGHTDAVCSVDFSPDGKQCISGSRDHTLKLWDIVANECIRTMEAHTDSVASVCFSPNGNLVISGSWDKTLKLWNIETGACNRTMVGHQGKVESVGFSPDGERVISGSHDGTAKIWNLPVIDASGDEFEWSKI